MFTKLSNSKNQIQLIGAESSEYLHKGEKSTFSLKDRKPVIGKESRGRMSKIVGAEKHKIFWW